MSDSQLHRLREALGGRYAIDEEVGAGGMATVYRANDVKHNRKVALKVLRPELAATMGPERFLQEVQVTANLQHPHILPLFDSGEADGFLYYVMPYLEGESLRERLAREGELPVPEAAKILKEVVDALSSAHAQGVVHRDIKPDNVMLSGRHAMVTDFGVAKAVSEATGRHHLTTAGVALGTPAYMAPEQAAADEHIDHRADIYAVGALGYELLTGRPPFAGRSPQQVLSAHVTEVPQAVTERRSSVPPELGAVIMRCLEKKPADRWQGAEELLTQLEPFATPSGGMTPTVMQPVEAASDRSGPPLWMKVALPLVAVVAAVALWLGPLGEGSGEDASDSAATAMGSADELDRLVVVPLQNLSADTELDVWGQLAVDLITRAIDQAGPIHVISTTAVRDALSTVGEDATVSEVARALGARYALAGTVARTGDQVRFTAEILEAGTGERLRDVEPQVGPADSVEAVAGHMAEAAAVAAIVLFDPGAEFGAGIFSVPTSISVFQDFQRQLDLFCQARYAESIEMGDQVLWSDPDYIPAILQNRISYLNSGRVAEADSVSRLLAPMRHRMTTGERLVLEWLDGYLYARPEQSERAADEMFRLEPTNGYSVQGTYRAGRIQDALARLEAAPRMESTCGDLMIMWSVQSAIYHVAGRYEDQLALARRGLERLPDHRALMDMEIASLAAMGQVDAADSVLTAMASLPPQQGYNPGLRGVLAARELRAHGHANAADRAIAASLEWFASQPPESSRYQRGRAYYYAGRYADADTLFAHLAAESQTNRDYLGFHGVTLAALGRRAEALAISDQLGTMERLNHRGRHVAWQARIAAALGDTADAVRLLDQAFRIGFFYSVSLHREPWWDPVRDNSAFQALIRPR